MAGVAPTSEDAALAERQPFIDRQAIPENSKNGPPPKNSSEDGALFKKPNFDGFATPPSLGGLPTTGGSASSKEVPTTNALTVYGNGPASVALPEDTAAKGFYKNFLTPNLSELEKICKESTDVLDELTDKWEQERKEKRRAELTKHVPGPLKGSGQSLEDIVALTQNLFMYQNFTDDGDVETMPVANLRPMTDELKIAMMANSLAGYVCTLEPEHRESLAARIVSDTTLWIAKIFRCTDTEAYYSEFHEEGLVKMCRLALLQKYPDFSEKGFEVLYTKPPVIYTSEAAKPGLGQQLCHQLGLPASCLCVVPCLQRCGAHDKIDTAELDRLVLEHESSTRTPLFLLAHAGTPVLGQVDNVQKLKEICKKHGMWLHVEGNNLATMSLLSVPTNMVPARTGDSLTLSLTNWLGVPGLPYVTLYKASESSLAHSASITQSPTSLRLACFPLWFALQSLGIEGIISKIKSSCNMAKKMFESLKNTPRVQFVDRVVKPNTETQSITGLGDLIGKVLSAILIFEMVSPTVVFRYGDSREENASEVAPYALPELTEEEEQKRNAANQYYNALNRWFIETVRKEVPKVFIEQVEVQGVGICMKFSPLETAQVMGTSDEDLEAFLSFAQNQLAIMTATLSYKEEFAEIVNAQENIVVVDIPEWAGLGCLQYIPTEWVQCLDDLPEAAVVEISKINLELVHQLKANDSAFSLGRLPNGLACARFGMVTEDTDIEDLIGMVYTMGKEIEEASRYQEKMAERVKQGIEAANKDLERAQENKLMQEGVLRQVPLVGSLFNWLSPPPKEASVRGRAFNLSSGKVLSTEETYKNHMQIQEASDGPSSAQQQLPYKAALKLPKKSRQSISSDVSVSESESSLLPSMTETSHTDGQASPLPNDASPPRTNGHAASPSPQAPPQAPASPVPQAGAATAP